MRVEYEHVIASNALRDFPVDHDYFRVVIVFTDPRDGVPVPIALEVNDVRYSIARED